MPLYEAVLMDSETLDRPLGILFDPDCASNDSDLEQWIDVMPALQEAQDSLRSFVGLIVQARRNRTWNRETHNYDFVAAQDYIVAAYIVAEEFGEPWEPGSLTEIWLKKQEREFEMWDEPSRWGEGTNRGVRRTAMPRTGALSERVLHVFQAGDAACKLSQLGFLRRIEVTMKQGGSYAEVSRMTKRDMAVNYGWQGGWLGVY